MSAAKKHEFVRSNLLGFFFTDCFVVPPRNDVVLFLRHCEKNSCERAQRMKHEFVRSNLLGILLTDCFVVPPRNDVVLFHRHCEKNSCERAQRMKHEFVRSNLLGFVSQIASSYLLAMTGLLKATRHQLSRL